VPVGDRRVPGSEARHKPDSLEDNKHEERLRAALEQQREDSDSVAGNSAGGAAGSFREAGRAEGGGGAGGGRGAFGAEEEAAVYGSDCVQGEVQSGGAVPVRLLSDWCWGFGVFGSNT